MNSFSCCRSALICLLLSGCQLNGLSGPDAQGGRDQVLQRPALNMRSDVSAESTALYRTAVNLYQQQQYDDATTTLKQISRHSAVFPDALVLQGLLHRTQGDFIAAEVAYQQSLELSPGNIHAHRNLAILYDLYLGQFDNALTHYETCEALAPGQYPELSIWIADLRQRIAQQLIAGAEK